MAYYGKLVLLLALCCFISVISAEIVQIGTGTLYNQCLPVEPMMSYSYSQSIYSSTEVGFGGYISSVGFQYRINSTTFLSNTNQLSIYMGTVNRDRYHTLTDWVPGDSLTLVFEGNLQQQWFSNALPGQGWLMIPLNSVYSYSGVGNLVIAVDENASGSGNMGDDFYCSACTFPQSIEIHSQTVNPNPASPPPAYNDNPFNPLSIRPNLRLEIQPVIFTPHSPVPVNNAIDVSQNLAFTWQSNAQSWDVLFSTINQPLQVVASGLTIPSWTPPNTLALYTDFHWQVIAHNGNIDYTGEIWSFRTVGEALTPPLNLDALTLGSIVRLTWHPPVIGNIVSYRIYRNQQLLDEIQDTEYYDNSTSLNQTYSYYVVGVNCLNQISPQSNTVIVYIPGTVSIYQTSFEDQQDFALSLENWTLYDFDHSTTWIWEYAFPHEGVPMSWIVFNPSQTTPPTTNLNTHFGNKMLLCVDSVHPPNNDWLISPHISIQNNCEISFWTRSYTDDFGLERLRFLISTTDTLTTSFEHLTIEPWINIPTQWTQICFDLSAYAGQQVYFAWNCVSWDAFALCLDDIVITQDVSNQEEIQIPRQDFKIYPNPARDFFSIENKDNTPFDVSIYNTKGQRMHQSKAVKSFEYTSKLATGIYFIRIKQNNNHITKRLVVY